MVKIHKVFHFLIFISVLSIGLHAQDDNDIYVIRDINFDIDGRSLPFVLMNHGEFGEGERIQGRDGLERYIAQKIQLLNNQRVLDNNFTRIEYTIGEQESDGALPVNLFVFVKDARNFVIFPEPRITASDGFRITLKARDYNFLGTMTPLRLDLGYQRNNSVDTFRLSFDVNMPFQFKGLDWNLVFDNNFSYDFRTPLRYDTGVGISLSIPWGRSAFSFGASQNFHLNNAVSSESSSYGVTQIYYDPYFSTELFGAWQLPLGIQIGEFGQLAYSIRTSYRINYPRIEIDIPKKPVVSITNSLGFGRVNWIDNFRSGVSFNSSIGNNIYVGNASAPFGSTFDTRFIYHRPIADFFGLSTQARYRQWWRWSEEEDDWLSHDTAGDILRGIRSGDLEAFSMLSLNLDFSARVMYFRPSEWFNAPRLSLFNMEIHLTPFMDMALAKGKLYGENITFSPDNLVSTAGMEIIFFSEYFRSLSLRGMFGLHLNTLVGSGFGAVRSSNRYDFYIGLDRAY